MTPRRVLTTVLCGILLVIADEGASQSSASGGGAFRPVFQLPASAATNDTRLILYRGIAPDGATAFYMIPPLIQAKGVEATGSSTVHYLLPLEVAWTTKLQELVVARTGNKLAPAALPVESVTVQIPQLGFVATARGDSIPPLTPSARLAVPFDVDPERVKIAYARLNDQDLDVRVTFRFGSAVVKESKLLLTREQFVEPIPTFPGSSDWGRLFRYAELENRLAETKNDAAVTQWASFQFVPLRQTGIDEVLREWFEEIRPIDVAGRAAVENAQKAPQSQQVNDPWKGLPRISHERVFRLKPGSVPPLEIMRYSFRHPGEEIVQSLKVGFTPAAVPDWLLWRQVLTRRIKLHVPCDQSPGVALPLNVSSDQKLELVLEGSTSREAQYLTVNVGRVNHRDLKLPLSERGAPTSWSTVFRAAGTPEISLVGRRCTSPTVEMHFFMVLYE